MFLDLATLAAGFLIHTPSALVGFLIGVVAAAIAVEVGLKRFFRPPAQTKVTASWRLSEFEAPLVVATDAAGTLYPPGAEVVTAGSANPQGFRDRTFRRNANARGNFLVDRNRTRALLFMGNVQDGTLAVSTVDPELVARLRAEHRRLWETAELYVEEMRLVDVVGKAGLAARTRGKVLEVVPYRGKHLMRITDGRDVVGVLVDAPLDLVGNDVIVTGRVARGTSGFTILEADEVRLVRESTGRGPQREVAVPVEKADRTDRAPSTAAPAVRAAPEERPAPVERVVRVRPPQVAAPPPGPEEPTVEFEEAETVGSEAERRKVKAKVVLHR